MAPSWKVLGRAASSMVNSGVLSWNRAISTDWAACYTQNTHLDFALCGPNRVAALENSTVVNYGML